MKNYDVVIVGSGIGGLCCGSILALSGKKVLICEAHSQPGGVAHSFSRRQRQMCIRDSLKAVPYIFFLAVVLSITTSTNTFV